MELVCENPKCKFKLTEQPIGADTWTCPVCGNVNKIPDAKENEDWLNGLCHYSGPGHDLPLGGFSKIPHFNPVSLAQTWLVATDEGVLPKKTKDVAKEDVIVGVTMNPESLKAIVDSYGEDWYQIQEANGGPLMTLNQWQLRFKTNGLGLVAIRNMRIKLQGPGVHF